jgi:hypothetical protein
MRRRQHQIITSAVVAAAALGVWGSGTAAAEPTGEASGVGADVVTPVTSVVLPLTPLVTLPPGGQASIGSLNVPGALTAGVLNAQSQATGSGATSSASVANLLALAGVAPLTADVVSSSCTSDASGVSGTSAIANGSFAGTPLAVSPSPNTTVGVPPLGAVVLNEQQQSGSAITVRAIHATVDTPLGVSADIPVATSTCDSGLDVLGTSLEDAPVAPSTQRTPSLAG